MPKSVNVLPKFQYDKLLRKPKLKNTKVKLTAYNGTNIPVVGRCIVRVVHKKNRDVPVMFIVAETTSPPILGLSTCENLNLIKRVMVVKSKEKQLHSFISEFECCFGELGTLPKVHKIVFDPSVPPVDHPPRRVPISLQPELKEKNSIERGDLELYQKSLNQQTGFQLWWLLKSQMEAFVFAWIRKILTKPSKISSTTT